MSDIDSRYFVTYPSRTNTTIALTLIFVTVVVIIFIVVIVLLLRKSTSSSTCTAAPSPPTGVTAVYVSPTQFNVTWAPVQAAISYTIYIGTINGFSPGQAILTKSMLTVQCLDLFIWILKIADWTQSHISNLQIIFSFIRILNK